MACRRRWGGGAVRHRAGGGRPRARARTGAGARGRARVLAPGGALIVSVPNFGHWYVRARALLGHLRLRPARPPRSHPRAFLHAAQHRARAAAGAVSDGALARHGTAARRARAATAGKAHAPCEGCWTARPWRSGPTLFGYQFIYHCEASPATAPCRRVAARPVTETARRPRRAHGPSTGGSPLRLAAALAATARLGCGELSVLAQVVCAARATELHVLLRRRLPVPRPGAHPEPEPGIPARATVRALLPDHPAARQAARRAVAGQLRAGPRRRARRSTRAR